MPVEDKLTPSEASDESALQSRVKKPTKPEPCSVSCSCQGPRRFSNQHRACDCRFARRRQPCNCPCSEIPGACDCLCTDLAEPAPFPTRPSRGENINTRRSAGTTNEPTTEDDEDEYGFHDCGPRYAKSSKDAKQEELSSDSEVDELVSEFDKLANDILGEEDLYNIFPPRPHQVRHQSSTDSSDAAAVCRRELPHEEGDTSGEWMEVEKREKREKRLARPSLDMVAPGLLVHPVPDTTEWHRQQQRSKRRGGAI
ncbi:hypothetical protein Dda_3179 [Drechslerella dactyloides]|uniref:Uncharacterized protein n=1 Tax=Drechslerella dactyloides TaxID=74499 RepID=A0AAD6J1G8_DREDA|nr:hypothetical protein Dda_3179 [Drechslerella dactyloides]